MKRKALILVVILLVSLATAIPVLAAVPAVGTVTEGAGVPGIDLGDSRAQVEAAFGQPASCQNLPYYDGRQGVNGICEFDVDGGGQVTLHYFYADGGPAQDSPDDMVFSIRWPEAVSGRLDNDSRREYNPGQGGPRCRNRRLSGSRGHIH